MAFSYLLAEKISCSAELSMKKRFYNLRARFHGDSGNSVRETHLNTRLDESAHLNTRLAESVDGMMKKERKLDLVWYDVSLYFKCNSF